MCVSDDPHISSEVLGRKIERGVVYCYGISEGACSEAFGLNGYGEGFACGEIFAGFGDVMIAYIILLVEGILPPLLDILVILSL